ncbi:DUF1295-domain-containing protein [Collybia nuda]|uniref:DUF1295-domain-containing protein n=1 Tax=Collybia nuda TaxID=64659 RepID=A0A9P5XUZ0_9AGAR|nr:DUF1295-domain-containing protein [Collybia nuda]
MAPIYVLDHFYLSISLLATGAYQLLGFAIAWTFQFDKITDFMGALLTLLIGDIFHGRNIIASILVMFWAVRISVFLLLRVLKTGRDTRFDNIRSHFFKFMGQVVWVWTVSLPLVILNSPAVSDVYNQGSNPTFGTSRDIAGIALWSFGFVIESVADIQKYLYKSSKSSPVDRPITHGLWGWSRHPSYFGEMMCWWGLWILCLSPATNGHLPSSAKAALYGAIISPTFTVLLLMFASGLPTAEKPQAKKYYMMANGPDAQVEHFNAWRNYQEYLRKTSILVPMPPVLYKSLPGCIKRTILLDFPMYEFHEAKEGINAS